MKDPILSEGWKGGWLTDQFLTSEEKSPLGTNEKRSGSASSTVLGLHQRRNSTTVTSEALQPKSGGHGAHIKIHLVDEMKEECRFRYG